MIDHAASQIPGSRPAMPGVSAVERLRGPHKDLVRELRGYCRDLPSATGVSVVVLRGTSGYGKSRLIRELYRTLRADGADRYWPALPGWGDEGDLDGARKTLGPDLSSFIWPEDAVPSFAWWHLNCEDSVRGGSTSVSADLRRQLTAHTVPLDIAQRQGKIWARRMRENLGRALIEIARDEATDQLRSVAQAALLPLLPFMPLPGVIIGLGERGIKAWHTRRKIDKALAAEGDTAAEVLEHDDEYVEAIARSLHLLSSPSLPAILVVEDLHAMSREVRILLDAVIRLGSTDPNRGVLVLATEWPEGSRAEHRRWREEHKAVTRTIDVPALPTEDLADLILAGAPGTHGDVARALAEKLRSPLIAKMWLAQPSVRQTIVHEGLDGACVDALRGSIDEIRQGILQEQWRELPEDVRTALMFAVAAEGTSREATRYVPEVVAGVGAGRRSLDSLQRAVVPLRWSRQVDTLHEMDDVATACVAKAVVTGLPLSIGQRDDLPHRTRRASVRYLEDALARLDLDSPSVTAAEIHAAGALRTAPPAELDATALLLTDYVAAVHEEAAGRPGDALDRVLALGLTVGPPVDARALAAAALLAARCAIAIGAQDTSRLEPTALLLDAASSAVAGDPSALRESEHRELAASGGELHLRLDAARGVDVAARVRSQVERVAASGADGTQKALELVALAGLALDAQGRRPAAAVMRAAFDVARASLGLSAPLTLQIASDYLALTGHDGNARDHAALVAEVLDAARETFGPEDYRTLDLERQQLRWELKAEPSEALARRFGELADRMDGVMDPFARAVVMTRIEEAQAWSRCGGAEHALELVNTLHARAGIALGERHPLTLRIAWYRTHQIEPHTLMRKADVAALIAAAPDGPRRSSPLGVEPGTLSLLRRFYAVGE